ncbi:MAG: hypothetical protein HOL98_17675 [Gammaproteobacteria bacterium]|nr:hypothetical protein [Gammaproteobacteria bacterium]MBT5205295.1 hypothetical protein [Gammaproteobacteria bacterium]MBT5602593.1 hypothetical protein [Gammaproteobacteria bacterium]MBT6245809.1 hypothetical protein [Gammaproteobacteria bacterium]
MAYDFYFWPTPNGYKVSIALKELDQAYNLVPVNITKGEQHNADFVSISPAHKIPALVDHRPRHNQAKTALFESGAILMYLAEKHQRLIPRQAQARMICLQWLFWQVGGLGPMAGQAHHFRLYAQDRHEYAIQRYQAECARLYAVLNVQLEQCQYLAGEYSIADIACLAWVYRHERHGIVLQDYPYVQRWYQALLTRPAVEAGFAEGAALIASGDYNSHLAKRELFGLPGEDDLIL